VYADHLVLPWLRDLLEHLLGVRVFDAHTHVGERDPSGFATTFEELLGSLEAIDARAVVFPLAEPGGYRGPNRACAEAAVRSGGRLTAFVRLTPGEVDLLDEGLAGGARGVKLHLSSDDFSLDDPRLHRVYEVADERRLPMIVHAGPELGSIGRQVLDVCARWPGLRLVLAHCGLTDLGWLHRHVGETPNLFFDTSWWNPAHLLALFRLVPPGRILGASDLPYSTPVSHTLTTARCAWQAGLDPAQLASVVGGQVARLVDGAEPLDLGPPPAAEPRPPGPLLEVLSSSLLEALEAVQRGHEPGVPLSVARHACRVADDDPDAPVVAAVARLPTSTTSTTSGCRGATSSRPGGTSSRPPPPSPAPRPRPSPTIRTIRLRSDLASPARDRRRIVRRRGGVARITARSGRSASDPGGLRRRILDRTGPPEASVRFSDHPRPRRADLRDRRFRTPPRKHPR
jgi:hypothetical protein